MNVIRVLICTYIYDCNGASWCYVLLVDNNKIIIIIRARLLAASAPHSGDWLHALPISSCSLRLDDDAVRVAVGLRLGSVLCMQHVCPCGATVDCRGTHGLSCKISAGRTPRHAYLNDIIHRALVRAGVSAVKEPAGLSRTDGKRPDGVTLVPWQAGRSAAWDVTVIDTLATSYLASTSVTPGSAAEIAAARKEDKVHQFGHYTHVRAYCAGNDGPNQRKVTRVSTRPRPSSGSDI